jgi:hypothetical protein
MATRGNIEDDPIIAGYLAEAGVGPADNGGEGNTDGTQTQEQSGDEQSGQQQAQQGTGQETPKPDSASGSPDGQQQPNGQAPAKPNVDPAKPAQQQQLKAGEIRLEDGTIVAAGKERRFYENMRIAREQADSYKKRADGLDATIKQHEITIQSLQQSIQAIGASNPQEVSDSLRLFKDLRNNPVGTVQTLLAELAAAGVDLSSIASGLDMKAMQAMLDQRLPPQQQQQQQQQQEAPAVREAREFATAHPDAMLHQDVVIRLAQANPNMTLESIYWELRKSVADGGYDWSQPLGPQYQSRQSQQQQQPNKPKPMPNGGGGFQQQQMQDAQDVFSKQSGNADESLDAIVRSAMRETGYRSQN